MRRMAWGITGAGQYLEECISSVMAIKGRFKVCTLISSAGEEVLRMYGLERRIREISGGGYLEEILLETSSGRSFPKAGRFMQGKFDLLLVAPATANTVAKIAHGVADGLVTNAISMADKAAVPIYILPTDVKGYSVSKMPYLINRDLCLGCETCLPRDRCPAGAIHGSIDLRLCSGCGICAPLCDHGAIAGGELRVRTREVDHRNIEILRSLPGFTVLEGPSDIARIKS